MLFIDAKYASMLSPRLRNFKQQKDYLWNFSCPICGDSSKNKLKARGYIYKMKSDLCVKCHNCGYGANLGNFIKQIDTHLYDEYVIERYKAGAVRYNAHKDISAVLPKEKEVTELLEDEVLTKLQRLDLLDESHPAVQYCVDRKIPKDKFDLIYFCKKFKQWSNSIKFKFANEDNDAPRLVFPFFTPEGKVFAYSGRAFGKEEPKYITIKLDEDKEKIYGMDRVDWSKKVFVVEGQIDSLFLPNCLAVSGASFDLLEIQKVKTNSVLIMDNEPRNKDIVKQLEKYIKAGYTVCMFPETIEQKDINDMILNGGMSVNEIVDTINKNSYTGLNALARFATWRKV